jgi:hypothetical protein
MKRLAFWGDAGWALARIGRAFQKYSSVPVDMYDWSNSESNIHLFRDKWMQYDSIIVTTIFSDLNWPPHPDLYSRLVIIGHFPLLDHPYFRERPCICPGARYAGVSLETCREMERHGMKPAFWCPFGVDTDLFPVTHTVSGPIRRIGIIGNPYGCHDYIVNKGLREYADMCSRLGLDPVWIHGREGTIELYSGIDMLICMSRLEAGPLGIFEAAACGLPVLTRPVGNAQRIKGIQMFDTVDDAVRIISRWNKSTEALRTYTERVTHEVRTTWSMERLIPENLSHLNM